VIELVRSGPLTLGFLPAVGGRLLSLQHGRHELLWRNPGRVDADLRVRTPPEALPAETDMASWWNFGGSKTWPAPQHDGDGVAGWGGPPDPVLDGGSYALEVHCRGGATEVTLTSAPDPRTGLQISRRFLLEASRTGGFRQQITFRNCASRAITWAIWEVCQVDCGSGTGTVQVDLAPDGRLLDLGSYAGSPAARRSGSGVDIPVQPVVAKWGFSGAASRISYADAGLRLSLSFRVEPGARYPEGGCCAELWMQHPTDGPLAALDGWQPDAALLELEVLGPLRRMEPGATTQLEIDWSVEAAD